MIKTLKKKKDNPDFINDIKKVYYNLSKKERLFFITLEGIPSTHVKDLNFQLTNLFFNTIHRNCKYTYEYINYLFIIEYGGIISKKEVYNLSIKDLGIHSHCIVNSSLTKQQLEFYINTCFKVIPNYKILDITKSDTKENLLNYLLKQNGTGLMGEDNYNYKVAI